MDIESLREQYLEEIKAEKAVLAPAASSEEVAAYAETPNRDPAELCAMIASLKLDPDSLQASIRQLLSLAERRDLGSAPRLAALRQLGSAEFQPGEFAPFRPNYIAMLRRLATDPDKAVRTAALERLTLANDPEAQRLLLEGLEKARKPLVSAAKAVQLLARDDHGGGLRVFRTLAANATGRVRDEALRALAGDARSAPLFEAIAADKAEKPTVREIAAINLKNVSATRFAKLARKLVLDEGDDDRVRAAAVSVIVHSQDVAAELASPRFANAIKAAGLTSKSRALKSSINRFARKLDRK
jgi:hypothetical protein